ncbi:Gfo/Idh/MocA family protein [Actinocatenispora rupis]|uniref:Oxidoreductase n=1 Tax=Actinocatenispora rupis TaxID=519421 RepID=A0A8J3IVX9_9ACTN|nr:Gfo/Idh/MocA family oxidoreductase [Actinocatenispora rupis]GID10946.1 oxidoreductase [Actinocatenispora rupis]
MRVGVVSCGTISGIYLANLARFPGTDVVACADLRPERARAAAERYPGVRAVPVADLLAAPDVELVVNLTLPDAHVPVSLAAVEAGKHVYTEKPLATGTADGARLLEAARERGVRVGSAPDTFLGAGVQTCRALLDDGAVGVPVGATATLLCPGHESWHPAPDFYYQPGAGPLFDMGPYYLTALVDLLGPVTRVAGTARATFGERVAADGHVIPVHVPTHVGALLEFASGAVATVVLSFDVAATAIPYRIELYGATGTLTLGDPNAFGGPVRLGRRDGWTDVTVPDRYAGNERGLGVAEMVEAIDAGRPHRASGALALHVVAVLETILTAARAGTWVDVEPAGERPAAFPGLTA